MAWQPVNDFDYAVLSMQPDHNFIFGQLQFEEQQKKYFTPAPKPQWPPKTSNRNNKRETLMESLEEPRRSQVMQEKLIMMEKIQRITGTKRFGEHASLADWDNNDDFEAESIAMMRHFGMMSMIDADLDKKKTLPITVPTTGMYVSHNGKRKLPVLLDKKYFEPKTPPKNHNEDGINSRNSSETDTSIYNSSSSSHASFKSASDRCSGEGIPRDFGNVNLNIRKTETKTNQADDELICEKLYPKNSTRDSRSFNSDESYKSALSDLTGLSHHSNNDFVSEHDLKNEEIKNHNNDANNPSSLKSTVTKIKPKLKHSKRPPQKARLLSCHQVYNLKNF